LPLTTLLANPFQADYIYIGPPCPCAFTPA
jgi:hypothetical protein